MQFSLINLSSIITMFLHLNQSSHRSLSKLVTSKKTQCTTVTTSPSPVMTKLLDQLTHKSPIILLLIKVNSLLTITTTLYMLLHYQLKYVDTIEESPNSLPAAHLNEQSARSWSLPNRPSLFNIIRFPNEECFDSSNQSGTCYTAFECKLIGGQPSSPCAAGFGSCCIVSRTCHVTTREKVVYFKNPNYPSADSEERFCDLTIAIDDPNVCQLRIDFLDFQLDQPTNGACNDDYLEISASGLSPQTVPRLCGLNRNQHLYISVPQDFTERSASIVFYTDAVGDHRWQLKITQIDCQLKGIAQHLVNKASGLSGSPLLNSKRFNGFQQKYSTTFASGFNTMTNTASMLAYEMLRAQITPRAPNGCLQYFTSPSGIIESFNFGQYLNQMDYTICIQRHQETCRIVFTSSDYDWSINGVGVSSATSGVGDQDCARDYLMIPGGSRNGDGFTYDRYCGGRLNYYRGQTLSAPIVIKTNGPIVLRFHSDSTYESVNSGGFRLQYEQSNQDCMYHSAEEAGSLSSTQLIMSTFGDSQPLPSSLQVSHNDIDPAAAATTTVTGNHGSINIKNNKQEQQIINLLYASSGDSFTSGSQSFVSQDRDVATGINHDDSTIKRNISFSTTTTTSQETANQTIDDDTNNNNSNPIYHDMNIMTSRVVINGSSSNDNGHLTTPDSAPRPLIPIENLDNRVNSHHIDNDNIINKTETEQNSSAGVGDKHSFSVDYNDYANHDHGFVSDNNNGEQYISNERHLYEDNNYAINQEHSLHNQFQPSISNDDYMIEAQSRSNNYSTSIIQRA